MSEPLEGDVHQIRLPHLNHERIVAALQSALGYLRMTEHLTIVGSLGRFLAREAQAVGDIDVLIAHPLCERYWDFLKILGQHKIRPVFDVAERPEFPWNFCCPRIAHALALTVDCSTNASEQKHANLDICLKASDLDAIPRSDQWVHLLEPERLRRLDETAKARAISQGHQKLMDKLKHAEKELPNRRFHDELGLWFGW